MTTPIDILQKQLDGFVRSRNELVEIQQDCILQLAKTNKLIGNAETTIRDLEDALMLVSKCAWRSASDKSQMATDQWQALQAQQQLKTPNEKLARGTVDACCTLADTVGHGAIAHDPMKFT